MKVYLILNTLLLVMEKESTAFKHHIIIHFTPHVPRKMNRFSPTFKDVSFALLFYNKERLIQLTPGLFSHATLMAVPFKQKRQLWLHHFLSN